MRLECFKNNTVSNNSVNIVKTKSNVNSKEIEGINSYSVYKSTCPIGASYYHPSFGLSNPRAALYRAEQLKEKYAQKGLKYLLPNEIMDNKKIFSIIDMDMVNLE